MKAGHRQSAVTLIEMTVVIALVAMLAVFALPAGRLLFHSFESQAGTKAMISAALAGARAIAANQQRYAGIRFQHDLFGHQYIIFIVHDPANKPEGTGLANGFRAVEGIEPIKLPDSVGVMDFAIVTDRMIQNPMNCTETHLDDASLTNVQRDNLVNDDFEFTDTSTFSIIFSPSGKLVIHAVWLRNRDGETDDSSEDDVFNTLLNVDNGLAMFIQDDYWSAPNRGLGPEPSRRSFVIYDKLEFDNVPSDRRWSNYLYRLEGDHIYVNPYTGTFINK